MNHIYTAFNLNISSAIPLPGPIATNAQPDVFIKLGRLRRFLSEITTRESDFEVTKDGVFLFFESEGTLLVRGGNEIIVDPVPGVSDWALSLIILGPALAILLSQRGLLTLHGAALALGGNGIVFLGERGCGKSTLAAAFHSMGYSVLSDDITAVQIDRDNLKVLPGFPIIKLESESAAPYRENLQRISELPSYLRIQIFHVPRRFPKFPLPLKHIYVLAEAQDIRIEPLGLQDSLVELVRHSYRASLLKGIQTSWHFLQCTSLVNNVPIRRLNRPLSLSSLPNVVRIVEKDLACN